MRTMKDSGIEWIGEIPGGWEVPRVKDLCDYWNGLTYSPDCIADKGTLVLRSSNIQDGSLVFDDCVYRVPGSVGQGQPPCACVLQQHVGPVRSRFKEI